MICPLALTYRSRPVSDRYMTLIGAEQVQSAGHTMRSAADDMRQAASQIDEAFHRQRLFMDDWLMRLEGILTANKE